MDAFMRMVTGKEERTIADRISDPNRPTWEQYKKENADKLDLNDNGEKEMKAYRKKLDAAREKVGLEEALVASCDGALTGCGLAATGWRQQQLEEEEEEAQEALALVFVGGFQQRGRASTLQAQEPQEKVSRSATMWPPERAASDLTACPPPAQQEEPQASKKVLRL
ncbi:unnamed protein product [Phytophthora fragariaefolia]|uniref:Unnamed protein product n=1 Tax=Phytophthora fragariaefolia TaxID=1490495 RepID=A0A9W6U6E1_9STRA|nr:unnamed protein product [Phytophthora fragariaefolia]